MKTFPSNTLIVSLGFAASLQAQTSESLQDLVVTASKPEKSLTVASADLAKKELAETPGGTEVIEAERFLTGRASTLADTFALSPGVVAQSRFGSDEARISIRGSGLQRTFHGRGIRVLQDGIPINLADGGFDMQAIDPLAADYVTVLRGSNALSLGSSTLGGAINYVSATGLSDPGGSFRIEAGSYDYLRTRIAAGMSEGDLDGYFSLSEAYQSGFRDHAQQNAQRLFSNFGWKISDDAESRIYFNAVRTVSELPGNLTKAELKDNPRSADPSAISQDTHRDYELYRLGNKTVFQNGPNTFEFIASYSYKDLDHPLSFGVVDQLSNDLMLGTTFTDKSDFFGRENQFQSGLYLTRGEINSATLQNLSGHRGNLTAYSEQTATNLEFFAEDQLALGYGFTGVLGATAAHTRRENETQLGSAASYDRIYNDFSPKFGVRWDAENYQIYGNVSSSFEPPSFSETNGSLSPNKAQTADTIELGTRGHHGAFRWDADIYHSEIKNEFLALNDASGNPLGTTNADRTLHQGVEFFAEGDLLGTPLDQVAENRLFLRGAWTYGRFKFDGDETYGDNTIAGLPPHLIRGELIWQNQIGWYAGPTFEWVPVKSYVDHANTSSADPYALLGFKIGRRLDSGLSWFIEAKNLTDKKYAATTAVIADANGSDTRNFLPGDGRSVFAGIEFKW
ncbi:TonB-dependent receptor [Luteolibacter pohnpeiensis]|uniref:TonB-dependent receptor n=1 Tax=Luteolibacter pohnpeiensis TaxID=454153 RepID=A0A934SB42_9BACT|nr:TonB-dependent receptor [Luteolibacter pohnpeiensis]MBK1882654.1 TonB-dependent receptor [Luteolibacter pohnpeiensis]